MDDRSTDLGGDARADSVGADDPRGIHVTTFACDVEVDTRHPAVGAAEPGDGHPVDDVGAGLDRGVDQDAVEHGAPRRVQPVDVTVSAHVDHRRVVVVSEHDRAGDGGTCRSEPVEQAPAAQLQHAGAGQRVRRVSCRCHTHCDRRRGRTGHGERAASPWMRRRPVPRRRPRRIERRWRMSGGRCRLELSWVPPSMTARRRAWRDSEEVVEMICSQSPRRLQDLSIRDPYGRLHGNDTTNLRPFDTSLRHHAHLGGQPSDAVAAGAPQPPARGVGAPR